MKKGIVLKLAMFVVAFAISTFAPSMTAAAETRAEELTEKFSYQRPDGRREFTVLDDNNIADDFVGECYSAGQATPKEALDNMMQYDFFEKKVMSEDAKTVGVGHYNGGEYGDYWDVLFTAR